MTKDKLIQKFIEDRVEDTVQFPNQSATKVVRRGNIYFVLDEIIGKLVAFKQRKLTKAEKAMREWHTDVAYTCYEADDDILAHTHVDIPQKFIKVMRDKHTHEKLVIVGTERDNCYRESLDIRRNEALKKVSQQEGIPLEVLQGDYTTRLSKYTITLTKIEGVEESSDHPLPEKIVAKL